MQLQPLRTETGLMQTDINYLAAKLEEIHADVKQLKEHVDELRQEAAGRRATTRFILGALGVCGAVLGWTVSTVLSLHNF